MANISKTNSLSAQYKTGGKLMMLLFILLAICTFSQRLQADTSIYVFGPDQSMVIKTGGFAGVHETYAVAGQFRLTVDSDSSAASFEIVDANLTDEAGLLYGQSLDEIFNMTGLAGTVVDDRTIEFEGKTADGTESNVSLSLKLSIKDDSAHLTGKTTPPPNSADMFIYDVNAVATKKYEGGTGEPNNPYQIATVEDLMLLGDSPEDYDKHFILTADIDLNPNLPGRKIFDKAVIAPDMDPNDEGGYFQGPPFAGTFDGNGYMISHLTIEGTGYLGLFGRLVFGAKVSNLGIVDAGITGSADCVGGLVGYNDNGGIVSSYSSGSVSAAGCVGGLVGFKCFGSIDMSYSSALVNGRIDVGGLVGRHLKDRIDASYSTGAVNGDIHVGGLVGFNIFGYFTQCYSTGSVSGMEYVGGLIGRSSHEFGNSVITQCFWDIQTSGQATSAGGIGKTTAEMQMLKTFLEAGWDFVGETDNGTEDIWSICEGTNYPRLVWQIPAGDFVCPDGITVDDFSFFMEHWLDDNCDLSNGYCQGTDLDQSGTVDVNDLEIFFELWSAEN